MNTFAYKSLGCKVNQYEGDGARDLLERAGLVEVGSRADLVILNTCAVTERAAQKARQALRRLRRTHPGAVTVITGCMSPDGVSHLGTIAPGAHLVLNQDRGDIAPLLNRLLGDRRQARSAPVTRRRTRAFLKVQDGCRLRCSFCIIPTMRGTGRSRPLEDVVREFSALADSGHLEVVLCGIHLGHWGLDLAPLGASGPTPHRPDDVWPLIPAGRQAPRRRRLEVADLAAALLGTTATARLRLSSLEINEVSDRLLAMMASDSALVPHLHIPLQSGSPSILRQMRRPYTASYFEERIQEIRHRVPRIALTTDLIIGFPGETDADFEQTLEMARIAGFSKIHAFPFSPRRGTPAASFPDRPPPSSVQQRMERCRVLEGQLRREFNRSFLGEIARVVPERCLTDGSWTGLTEHYQRVLVRAQPGRGTRATTRHPPPPRVMEVLLERDDGRQIEATRVDTGPLPMRRMATERHETEG